MPSEAFTYERNCLSFWQPKLEAAGVPTPRTTIIRTDVDLTLLLDGILPPEEGWEEFLSLVQAACFDHGLPCFLRTGQGSGKHDWLATCFVPDAENVGRNIVSLVEWSHLADIMGLPHDVWAVRDMLETEPLFRCGRYNGFPVTREYRMFIRGGRDGPRGRSGLPFYDEIEHFQPYWPPDAVEQGGPDRDDWRDLLASAARITDDEATGVANLAYRAWQAVGGGYWSIDMLQDRHGKWWVTDMALGERSFRYEPECFGDDCS